MLQGLDDPNKTALTEYLVQVLSGAAPLEWDSIRSYVLDWTDHTASDPGVTLLQLWSWLTEALLYRRPAELPAFPHLEGDSEPLRELIAALVNEIDSIHRRLDELYDNSFIDTAENAGEASLSDTSFPGVFVEEIPFGASRIPGVTTSPHLGPAERLVIDAGRPGKQWVRKFEAPDLNAQATDVPIEPIELGDLQDPDPEPDPE